MNNVLNAGSDVSGDEGPYPKERWVDRYTVVFDIFVLPFDKGSGLTQTLEMILMRGAKLAGGPS